MEMEQYVLSVKDLNLWIGEDQILKDISIAFHKNKVTAIMGPSGCGKTTLVRCFNRLSELISNLRITGEIHLFKQNILAFDPILVRRKIGMVFQRPNPFPNMSIYENVISGYRLNGIKMAKSDFDDLVEENLKKVALWDEVKDGLHRKGTFLSGGQQQRLCIARAMALRPRVLLLDEPTSALDPRATSKIEDLIEELKSSVTIIMVTHNTGQASRVSDYTAFLYLGELVEYGKTKKMFTSPDDPRTEEYLTGKFG